MTIDWTKPIETMDGRPARVIATDIKGDRSILVAALNPDRTEKVYLLDKTGKYSLKWGQLVRNVPPAPVVRYFNVYRDHMVSQEHDSRKQADHSAGPDRIACVRVEFKEGQFDE